MTTETIFAVMTSLTAIAAVIAPVVSARFTVKSNERMKQAEIYAPRLYAAVRRLSEAYAKFNRSPLYKTVDFPSQENVERRAEEAYREFSAAAYDVMSLVADPDVHQQICGLLQSLEKYPYILDEQDSQFQALSKALAKTIAGYLSLSPKDIGVQRKGRNRK